MTPTTRPPEAQKRKCPVLVFRNPQPKPRQPKELPSVIRKWLQLQEFDPAISDTVVKLVDDLLADAQRSGLSPCQR